MHDKLSRCLDDLMFCRYRKEVIAAFFQPEGPSALTWFYQTPNGKPLGATPQLFLGDPQACNLNKICRLVIYCTKLLHILLSQAFPETVGDREE